MGVMGDMMSVLDENPNPFQIVLVLALIEIVGE